MKMAPSVAKATELPHLNYRGSFSAILSLPSPSYFDFSSTCFHTDLQSNTLYMSVGPGPEASAGHSPPCHHFTQLPSWKQRHPLAWFPHCFEMVGYTAFLETFHFLDVLIPPLPSVRLPILLLRLGATQVFSTICPRLAHTLRTLVPPFDFFYKAM